MPLLTLKRANGFKRSYGETFDKLLVFFDQKYHFLKNLDTRKNQIKMVKNKPSAAFITLKRANELKTRYGERLDKLLVFFDQKYHFLENLDSETQKRD